MKISELPQEIRTLAIHYFKTDIANKGKELIDDLEDAFSWPETKEGYNYWANWNDRGCDSIQVISEIKEPKHYDNSKGSLYKFCEQQGVNSYEFDIIKRVMRCRKKGNFIEDLEKTKFLINLYINEQSEQIQYPHRES